MPKIVNPLTDTQVKNAKPKPKGEPKQYRIADGGGLYLRVQPWGAKKWLFNYQRPYSKQRTNIIIGSYPEFTLAEARELRAEYKRLLAHNIDPQEYKKQEKEKEIKKRQSTFKAVTDEWVETIRPKRTPDYLEDVYNSLKNHVFPKLGKKPIYKLKAQETIEALQPLADAGKLDIVKRICQRINMVMVHAINVGILEDGKNPLIGIGKAFPPPEARNNPTIKPDELVKLLNDLEFVEIRLVTRQLFHFQLHTLVRPSEACGAKWEEIDMENNLWTLPRERMKANEEHAVPLTEQVMEILIDREKRCGHMTHVFPSISDPKKHISNATINNMLKRNGYQDKLTAHGIRAIGSTTLNEYAFDSDLIEVILSHIGKDKVRQSYNHAKYIPRRRKIMGWWSDYISAAQRGKVLEGKQHLSIAK